MTVAGVVWIEARFASFSALFDATSKMLIIFERSVWRCKLSSWRVIKSDQCGSNSMVLGMLFEYID